MVKMNSDRLRFILGTVVLLSTATLVYQGTLKKRLIILAAMQVISNESCVTFRPAEPEDEGYADITGHDSRCFAQIGFTKGARIVNYGDRCFGSFGTVLHELLHTLGFYHQHSDPQRDKYVKIHYDNIIPEELENFAKLEDVTIGNYGVPYDYNSVMHYGATAHSSNGYKTIEPLDPSAEIGQREGLSEGDIMKINRMYNCSERTD